MLGTGMSGGMLRRDEAMELEEAIYRPDSKDKNR